MEVTHDDSGSVLILALVFLVAVSLVVTALVSWVGDDLRNTSNFKAARSLEYASGGAVQLEIQITRYSYSNATASPVTCTPGGGSAISLDGQSIAVYCTVVLHAASASSRVVTLDACPSIQTAAACTANPFLQAVVTFDDYSNANVDQCTSSSNDATCGTGMTLSSWVLH
jgi:Tfp pilus assembly protein PilX